MYICVCVCALPTYLRYLGRNTLSHRDMKITLQIHCLLTNIYYTAQSDHVCESYYVHRHLCVLCNMYQTQLRHDIFLHDWLVKGTYHNHNPGTSKRTLCMRSTIKKNPSRVKSQDRILRSCSVNSNPSISRFLQD